MESIYNRTEQIKEKLTSVCLIDIKGLAKFVEATPINSEPQDNHQQENSLLLATINKSIPYLEIRRNIELDKDQNIAHSYSLIAHAAYPDTVESYYGTFGKEEILSAVNQMEKPHLKKKESNILKDLEGLTHNL